ncbi:hypothetical protein [Nocardiopsis sp. B62]|uniref:hypothetical protein n=1 Tax=Nocardiopsis sp. B62 TaxID=2824874 RepID=UPI001B39BA45|nr:hypothetical protein [Nocardiopsis sp. B62]MBQ1083906.1 hypothetical protein [Nocardiopsis sp. B62]
MSLFHPSQKTQRKWMPLNVLISFGGTVIAGYAVFREFTDGGVGATVLPALVFLGFLGFFLYFLRRMLSNR